MSNEALPVKQILEGVLLAAGKPMNLEQLVQVFDEHQRPDKSTLKAALEDIAANCEGRGFEVREVASGWRIQVRQELSRWVGRLWDEKPQRYTRALLETLALVAYRQPITRGEIEDVRGVSVSSNIMRTLQERDWVRIVGHRDVPGRPAMFATTRQFLDYFNLQNLDELPPLNEIRNLDEMAKSLGAEAAGLPEAARQALQEQDAEAESAAADATTGQEQEDPPLSIVEMAQQFQEESEQNVERLFAELNDLEHNLKTDFTDVAPRGQDASHEAEGECDEAVRVEITYGRLSESEETQPSETREPEGQDSSVADLQD